MNTNYPAGSVTIGGSGGAAGFPMTVDTSSTTDTDHGAGKVSYNNATQASATILRVDDVDNQGTSIATMFCATLGNLIYIVSSNTPTTYQVWAVTAYAAPAGYTNLTAVLVAKSAADFANNEVVRVLPLPAVIAGSVSPLNSMGVNGQFYMRFDSPFVSVYKKSAGTWTVINQNFTWAGQPDPTTCSGAVVTFTDWGQDFTSDGTRWLPLSSFALFHIGGTLASPVASLTGPQAASIVFGGSSVITIPASLMYVGCRFRLTALMHRTGAVGAITTYCKFGPNNSTADTTMASWTHSATTLLDRRNVIEFAMLTGNVMQSSGALGVFTETASQITETAALTLTNAHFFNLGIASSSAGDVTMINQLTLEMLP